MTDEMILKDAKELFDKEIETLNLVRDSLGDDFLKIVKLIADCKGKVVLTGIGKPGHIATKIAATMASLGTPAFYLHPAEAMHGDMGMLQKEDLLIAFSFSGESDEVIRILQSIKMIGSTIVAISGNPDSTLVYYSDYAYVFPKFDEACPLNLAPTSSTTAELVLGDAFAVCTSIIHGFTRENFALFHPAGSLGKKLMYKTEDLMNTGETDAKIKPGTLLKDAIVEMSSKALGIISITDNGKLLGVLTDGDLRRCLAKGADIYSTKTDDVMTKNPISVDKSTMAVTALQLMNEKNISALPVTDGDKVIGTIRINDITRVGIIL